MQHRKYALAFAAVLAGLAPAFAQDDAPPPETGAAGPESSESDAAPTDAAPAPPVEGAPTENQPGQAYLAEEHGDWELRCVKVEQGPEPCQLYQVLTDQNGGAVAEIVVFPLPEGQEAVAGALITTPLETLLTQQITVVIDDGEGRRYPFSFCTEQGCVARLGLTPSDLDALRRGSEARVRIVPARAPDQEVMLSASLSGFTAGFEAVTERAQQ
jgi:invasion protein IalB